MYGLQLSHAGANTTSVALIVLCIGYYNIAYFGHFYILNVVTSTFIAYCRQFCTDLPSLQEWKLMSCSHGQELGQLADLTSGWLFTSVQPIRSLLAC